MAKTPGQFARDVRRLPDQIQKAAEDATAKAALQMTRQIRQEIAKATGGDSRLSGVGKKGRKVGARYKVRGGANPSALITAEGPLHLVERDTKPHSIPRQRKRGKRRVVVIPGVGVRASAQHPGTKGKRPFQKGVEAQERKVPLVYQDEVRQAMRRTFGG